MNRAQKMEAFGKLLDVMDDLREKCPWDRKQTFLSLRNLTIEETYELADALIKEDMDATREELGDLLLHIVFYARIADEQNQWDIGDVLQGIVKKLIHRHPHIYGEVKVQNEEDVKKNWEQLKLKEGKKSMLEGVPDALPALIKAHRIQDKTAQVGFQWNHITDAIDKIDEELQEFKEACLIYEVDSKNEENKKNKEEEFGDLLFSLVNLSRYLDIDPETALEKTNRKFKSRFEYIERNAKKGLHNMTLEEMDDLWNEAKLLSKHPT